MDFDIYTRWKEEHTSVLEAFHDKNIFMLFSGGKDSSLAMHLLSKAGKEFGFDFVAQAAAFPVHRYTDVERKKIDSHWKKRGLDIIWHESPETDEYIKNAKNPWKRIF